MEEKGRKDVSGSIVTRSQRGVTISMLELPLRGSRAVHPHISTQGFASLHASRLYQGLNVEQNKKRGQAGIVEPGEMDRLHRASSCRSSPILLAYDLAHFVPHSGHTYAVASRTSSKFTAREHAVGTDAPHGFRPLLDSLAHLLACATTIRARRESVRLERDESRRIDETIASRTRRQERKPCAPAAPRLIPFVGTIRVSWATDTCLLVSSVSAMHFASFHAICRASS